MEGAELAGKILSTWLTLVLGLILLPSAFGVSLGISEIYMKILVKTLECSCRLAQSLWLQVSEVLSCTKASRPERHHVPFCARDKKPIAGWQKEI
ncbi:Glycerol-3-phosphate acyltransferase 3 [Tupaia chinensis]|uniref:Glycerol-3-phosphate acyltransferase 3 n=1 Tax=Tupaia chinensis TaxID=246437 RepID=L9KLP1_TUPCH|nr:Glycerol-3-phosphate acyltransferase 3 [Tupaia chinensis]